jgi:hypothetical protein
MNNNMLLPDNKVIDNTPLPDSLLPQKGWPHRELLGSSGKIEALDEIVLRESEKQNSLIQRWYHLTAVSDAPANASFPQREAARKSRLLSAVLFFFTLVIIVFLPCCLLLSNHYDFWIDAVLIVLSFIALGLNRKGKTFAAGVLVVAAFQAALTIIIFTTTPFDETSLQIYDLFIMTELLAVSLLPPRSVFIVAIANSAVILTSLLYEAHTPVLTADLRTQFIPVMIRPIALQFIIAGVTYVWVYSTLKAIVRADRAETVALLEHALVEQKHDLEFGIGQILQTHVAIANGNLNARAPLTQNNVLWQIARALNTLLTRFQRAMMAERELQRVKQAVYYSVDMIQQAERQNQAPCLSFTHTVLDPLIAALQGKTLACIQSSASRRNSARNPTSDPNSSMHTRRP